MCISFGLRLPTEQPREEERDEKHTRPGWESKVEIWYKVRRTREILKHCETHGVRWLSRRRPICDLSFSCIPSSPPTVSSYKQRTSKGYMYTRPESNWRKMFRCSETEEWEQAERGTKRQLTAKSRKTNTCCWPAFLSLPLFSLSLSPSHTYITRYMSTHMYVCMCSWHIQCKGSRAEKYQKKSETSNKPSRFLFFLSLSPSFSFAHLSFRMFSILCSRLFSSFLRLLTSTWKSGFTQTHTTYVWLCMYICEVVRDKNFTLSLSL